MLKNWLKINISKESLQAILIIIVVSAFLTLNLNIGFSWPFYIMSMLAAFLLSIFYPFSGLLSLTFLTIIFERFFTLNSILIGESVYKIYSLDIIMIAVIVGIFFKWISNPQKKFFHLKNSDKLLAAFIILNIFYFLAAILSNLSSNYLAFSTLKNYTFYPLLYFAAVILINSKEKLKKFLKFFATASLILIGFVISGLLIGEGIWSQFTPLTTFGTRTLAFTHGLYLSLAFLVSFFLWKKGKFNKTIIVILSLWALGILGSLMRHLWIALLAAFLVALLLIKNNYKKEFFGKIAKLCMVFIFVFVFGFYFYSVSPNSNYRQSIDKTFFVISERSQSINNFSQDESYLWRKIVWENTLQEFNKNPILGIGTGKKVYVEKDDYKNFVEVRDIHNSHLAIGFQFGLLGFLIWISFIFSFWHKKAINLGKLTPLSAAFWGANLFFLVVLFFQPYLETNLLSIFFWINLGILRNIKYKKIAN